MTDNQIDPTLAAAVRKIEAFITRTTGIPPTPRELADALTRYFVLKEILEFVVMQREQTEEHS